MEIEMEPTPLTFDDAEQMYATIMLLVSDLMVACGATIEDPKIREIHEQIDISVRDIHAYASPP